MRTVSLALVLIVSTVSPAYAESWARPGLDPAVIDPPDDVSSPAVEEASLLAAPASRGLRPHHAAMIVGGGITLGAYLLNGLMALLVRGTAQLGVGLTATPGARSTFFESDAAARRYAEQAWIPVVGAFLDAGAVRGGSLPPIHGLAGVMQLGGLATLVVGGVLGTLDAPVTVVPLVDPGSRTAGLTLGATF